MKNGFLKLSVLSLMLTGSIASANDAASTIPALKPGFGLSIAGLYLEPSASNLVYAIHTTPLPLPAPNWEQKVVSPDYSGALNLGVQYNLLSGKDQIKFDLLYFGSKDRDSFIAAANTSVGPPYYYGPAQQFILNTSANGTAKFNIGDGSLVWGHFINLTNNIQVKPFVGLSAAYLKEGISNNYYGTDPVYGAYIHSVYGTSKFIGIGPRFGIDSNYFITNRFAINAEIAGSLLAGSLDYGTSFTSWTAYNADAIHNSTPANTAMANQTQYRVVPEVGAKLAVSYTIPCKNSKSELTVQAGYLFAVYLNAIEQVLPGTLVSGSWEAGTVAIVTQSQQQSNIDLRGPFINLLWKF